MRMRELQNSAAAAPLSVFVFVRVFVFGARPLAVGRVAAQCGCAGAGLVRSCREDLEGTRAPGSDGKAPWLPAGGCSTGVVLDLRDVPGFGVLARAGEAELRASPAPGAADLRDRPRAHRDRDRAAWLLVRGHKREPARLPGRSPAGGCMHGAICCKSS